MLFEVQKSTECGQSTNYFSENFFNRKCYPQFRVTYISHGKINYARYFLLESYIWVTKKLMK